MKNVSRYATALAFVIASPLLAVTYIVPSDADLVARSEGIVVAKALESHSELTSDGRVVTPATFQVEESLKGGFAASSSITLVEMGGIAGGRMTIIPGSPRYENGKRYLIFLTRNKFGELITYGWGIGRFELIEDLYGRELAMRGPEVIFGFTESTMEPYVDHYRDAEGFITFIRANVGAEGGPARTDYFVNAPVILSSFARMPRLEVNVTRPDYMLDGRYRWQNGGTATIFHNGTQPGYDGANAVSVACNTWNGTGTSINYTAGGANASATGGLQNADGINAVLFNDPAGQLPPGVSAAGGFSNTAGTYQLDGVTFQDPSEVDVVINDAISPDQSTFIGLVTHELGHTLGFRHSNGVGDINSPPPACSAPLPCTSDALMNSVIFGSNLRQWDRDAAAVVYGSGLPCNAPAIQSVSANPSLVTPGNSSTLSANVSGTTPQTFQWFKGNPPDTSSPIPGATSSSVQVTPTANTTYFLQVTGCNQTVTSASVTVQVGTPCPSISVAATAQTVANGFQLTAMATGGTGFTYKWFIGQIGGPSAGPQQQQIVVNPTVKTTYVVRVVNDCGSFADATVTIDPMVPPAPLPTIKFFSSPAVIDAGASATLMWETKDATSVMIDNGVGTQPANGSATVTPAVTTTYTLTATGPGGMDTARATVTVNPVGPVISVTSFPTGIIQGAGQGGATDQYTITNLGRAGTTLTLTQTGNFFTQTPTSFDLAAGAVQVISILATPQGIGVYQGSSIISGNGVPSSGLNVAIKLLVASPPAGTVMPITTIPRPEVDAPPDQINRSGSVDITNTGTDTLRGIVVSDVPWLIPQQDPVTIPAGETQTINFMIDRTNRPDAGALNGAAVGKLSLVYFDTQGSSAGFSALGSGGSSKKATFSISIVDNVTQRAVPAVPAPLAAGEVALFAAGLQQKPAAGTDFLLSTIGDSISDLKLFFRASSAPSLVSNLGQLGPNTGVQFVSALRSVFAASNTTGTIQTRSTNISRVTTASIQSNTTNRIGSYITALPTFRSDRSVAPGSATYLPGVEKGGSRMTSLFIQEVTGVDGSIQIDYLDEGGTVLLSKPAEAIGGFALVGSDEVPDGARTIRVSNASTSTARIVAYAVVTDLMNQDGFVITDSALGATNMDPVVIPLFGNASKSLNMANSIYVVNRGTAPMDVTVDFISPPPAKRRGVRSSSLSGPNAVVRRSVAPLQTIQLDAPASTGFSKITATGPFAVSGRATLTGAGRLGTFGTALSAAPAAIGLNAGQLRRFGGLDDAARLTVAAQSAATYRSSLSLVETSGQAANVRLTLRYTYSASARVTALGQSVLDVTVPANQVLFLEEMSRAIIGSQRDTYGDLHNMQLDIEVRSGGKVLSFVRTIDNGSGDAAVRMD